MEKTKLIATVCESKNERKQIEEFIKSGIDVIRLNMSYSSRDVCRRLINIIDETNQKLGTNTAVMQLPEGWRPNMLTYFGGTNAGGSTLEPTWISINEDGTVLVYASHADGLSLVIVDGTYLAVQ